MSTSPYSMCSLQECQERQANKEVSIFECVDPTVPMQKRIIDPALAVQKYRRSAAGTKRAFPIRSLTQLELTVTHLMQLLVDRRSTPNHERQSLLDTANFVEDRLRAVQVDLVVSRTGSKRLQHRMARCQVLILYLMADTLEYQHKYGRDALETALSSYWNSQDDAESTNCMWDDEMLAFSTLVALNGFLQHQQHQPGNFLGDDHPSGLQSIYTIHRKHATLTQHSKYPLFQWALQLTANVHLGHWHAALRQLRQLDSCFGSLARCLMASSLSYMQYMALNVYNVSFAKAEGVSGQDLVRLLQFTRDNKSMDAMNGGSSEALWHDTKCASLAKNDDTESASLAFGVRIGLPLSEDEGSLVFKSAPMSHLPADTLVRNDLFVFGQVSTEKDLNGLIVPSLTHLADILL
ncbi:hypothetical protein MPSEU_000460000 [Mayamaea pseudoterrestris]|nr:hypothetical protein MPSEU_000460000 [Mayamaea pseudoterrestris]